MEAAEDAAEDARAERERLRRVPSYTGPHTTASAW
jgi:hypothetical protein